MKKMIVGLILLGFIAYCKASTEDSGCLGIVELSVAQLGAPKFEFEPTPAVPHSNDVPERLWNRLAFGSSGTVITSIEFETYAEPEHSRRRLLSVADAMKATKIVSVDKELLAMLQYSFAGSHCLRNIVPIGSEGGVGGSYLFGRLTFVTTKGTFCIGVGTTGFSIDGSVPGTNTEFYSPAGAELLSMLYCRRTGMPLPARHVSALNGQQFIDMQMYALHRSQWASNALGIEIEDASPPAK